MPDQKQILYWAYDPIENLYKIGTTKNLKKRFKKLKYEIGYEIDLVASIPGIDDFMRQYGLEPQTHPIKHDGRHEWYEDNEENIEIFNSIFKEGNTRYLEDQPEEVQQIIRHLRQVNFRKARKIDAYRKSQN